MTGGAVFGYGSLVNVATHDYANPRPATLTGWQRIWCHTPARKVGYLSVIPVVGAQIDGLVADVPGGDWAALDVREAAYQRTDITAALAAPTLTQIYAVRPENIGPQKLNSVVLLSYLDVVVQGYLQHFGEAGVWDFFHSTRGWDMPIVNDRAAPRYPRAQSLSRAETALVDQLLAQVQERHQPAFAGEGVASVRD